MKTPLVGVGVLAQAGFALLATGCVSEYYDTSPASAYSGTSLPAASRVALVMEFRGGEPSPQERAEVRALLADYLAGQGSVLVESPGDADYMVHAVLERRNPENPAEWTVVNTYSAQSLSAPGGDVYRWPGGIIEDDYYTTTRFTYIGFGVFYPVWFDLWDSPWHRGRVVVCPPPRRHDHYRDHSWRDERRWHRPDRWSGSRHRDWQRPPERRDDDRRRVSNRVESDRRHVERQDVRRTAPPQGAEPRSRRDGRREEGNRSGHEQLRSGTHGDTRPAWNREPVRSDSRWSPPPPRPGAPHDVQMPSQNRRKHGVTPPVGHQPQVDRSSNRRQEHPPRPQPPGSPRPEQRPRNFSNPGPGAVVTHPASEPPKPPPPQPPAVRVRPEPEHRRDHPPRADIRRSDAPRRDPDNRSARGEDRERRRDRSDDGDKEKDGSRR